MADINENQNGIFGGIQFDNSNQSNENTSFFENQNQENNVFANFENVNQTENAGNVFGGFNIQNGGAYNGTIDNNATFKPIEKNKSITKQGLWSRVKAFLFQEIDLTAPIKVELTPYQQKVEDEINEFLHQEVSFKGIFNIFKGNK